MERVTAFQSACAEAISAHGGLALQASGAAGGCSVTTAGPVPTATACPSTLRQIASAARTACRGASSRAIG